MISAGKTIPKTTPKQRGIQTIDMLPKPIHEDQKKFARFMCGGGWIPENNKKLMGNFLRKTCTEDMYGLYESYLNGTKGEQPGRVLKGSQRVVFNNVLARAQQGAYFRAIRALEARAGKRGRAQVQSYQDANFANSFMYEYVTGKRKLSVLDPMTGKTIPVNVNAGVFAVARKLALMGIQPSQVPTSIIVPPNVVRFASLGTPKFQAQFIRLYKDLMDRASTDDEVLKKSGITGEEAKYGAMESADKLRVGVGEDLIAKVKAQFNIDPKETDEQIKASGKLGDAAAKVLAGTLGHGVAATASKTEQVRPTPPKAPDPDQQAIRGGRIRNEYPGRTRPQRMRSRAFRRAMVWHKREMAAYQKKLLDKSTWETKTVPGSVAVDIRPVPKGTGLISRRDDYATVDNKRRLLNDAYYLRSLKEGSEKNDNTLRHAAFVTGRDLKKFMGSKEVQAKRVTIDDVRVIGVDVTPVDLGAGKVNAISLVKFGAVVKTWGKHSQAVLDRPDVKDKEMAKAAMERIWRGLYRKMPNLEKDPKLFMEVDKEVAGKLNKLIDENKNKYRHPDTREKGDGAVVLFNTYAKDAKASQPADKRVTLVLNPRELVMRNITGNGRDGVHDVVRRYLYKPAMRIAKDDKGNRVKVDDGVRKAIAYASSQKARAVYRKHGIEGLMGTRPEKVIIKKIGPDTYAADIIWYTDKDDERKQKTVYAKAGSGATIPMGKRGEFNIFAAARAGGDKGTTLDKWRGSGYSYMGMKYTYGLGERIKGSKATGPAAYKHNFSVKVSVLAVGYTNMRDKHVIVPHLTNDEDGKFWRMNGISLGGKIGVSKDVSIELDAGYVSARPADTSSVSPFNWTNYSFELADLAGASKMLGAGGSLVWKPTKNQTYRLQVMGGNNFTLYINGKPVEVKPSHRLIVSGNAEVKFGKHVTIAGLVTYDNSGSTERIFTGATGAKEYTAKASQAITAELGAKFLFGKGFSSRLGLRYFHQMFPGDGLQLRTQLTLAGNLEYEHKWFRIGANVNYARGNEKVSWAGIPGMDSYGISQNPYNLITADFYALANLWGAASVGPYAFIATDLDDPSKKHYSVGGMFKLEW